MTVVLIEEDTFYSRRPNIRTIVIMSLNRLKGISGIVIDCFSPSYDQFNDKITWSQDISTFPIN